MKLALEATVCCGGTWDPRTRSACFLMSASYKVFSTWSEFSRKSHSCFCRIVANGLLERTNALQGQRAAGFKLRRPRGHERPHCSCDLCDLCVWCLLSREPQRLGFGRFVWNPLVQRFSHFSKWGPLSLVRMFYEPPYSWDYQTH